jgi:hypothetical protein
MITRIAEVFDGYFQRIVGANRLAMERNERNATKLIQLRKDSS